MPFGIIKNARKVFPQNQLSKGAKQDLIALAPVGAERRHC